MLAARPDSSAMRRRSCADFVARTRRLARAHLALEQLRKADDAGQRIVELVRHACDQLTNRRQLLGLKQLRLRRLQALHCCGELSVGLAQLFAHVLQPPRRTNFFGHVLRDLHDRSAGAPGSTAGNVVTLRICSLASVISARSARASVPSGDCRASLPRTCGSWASARPMAQVGQPPPHSPTSPQVTPRISVTGRPSSAARARLPRSRRP